MTRTKRHYEWKDPKGLTKSLVIVFAIMAARHALSALFALGSGDAGFYEADAVDFTGPQMVRALLDLAELALMLAGLVVATMWIMQANRNAHTLRARMEFSPFTAVIWYLVPIASLFYPYQAMSEIWDASTPAGEKPKDGGILNWWWGLFIVSNIVGQLAVRLFAAEPLFWALSDILALSVCVIFIRIARRISGMQADKHMAATFGDDAGETPQILHTL